MQVTDARKMSAAEIAALMKKKAFDEVELSPRIQAGTDAMFGRHMTAAQFLQYFISHAPYSFPINNRNCSTSSVIPFTGISKFSPFFIFKFKTFP